MIAAALAYPAVNAIPNDFELAIAQQKFISQSKTANSRALLEPMKTPLDIYIAHNDVSLVSHDKGDHEKVVRANEFLATLSGTKLSPDAKTISDIGALAKIPETDKANFSIVIDNNYNGNVVNVYSSPSMDALDKSHKVIPINIITKDFTIYNSKFLKVKDVLNTYYYINIDEANWRIQSSSNYRITGSKGNYHITNKPKNLTLDPTIPTNLTADEIAQILAGSNLAGIEDAVVEVEEKYGVNALFTISLAMLESGHGKSYLARTRNNLFGICAYDGNEGAASSFGSKSECVRYWGKLIHDVYFANGRTSLESINAIYASNPEWASHVRSIMSRNAAIVQ
jgi:beta-N-acetylglucosaminidase